MCRHARDRRHKLRSRPEPGSKSKQKWRFHPPSARKRPRRGSKTKRCKAPRPLRVSHGDRRRQGHRARSSESHQQAGPPIGRHVSEGESTRCPPVGRHAPTKPSEAMSTKVSNLFTTRGRSKFLRAEPQSRAPCDTPHARGPTLALELASRGQPSSFGSTSPLFPCTKRSKRWVLSAGSALTSQVSAPTPFATSTSPAAG